jgi:DNA-binding transcriptional MerR regulator
VKALRPIDLGRAIGLSSLQVNRFERWGLLSPAERTPAGRRRYAERHLDEILALRAMQAGYGWRLGNRVMREVQKGDLAAALALVDEQHASLHRQRQEVADTLAALQTLHAAAAPPAGATLAAALASSPRTHPYLPLGVQGRSPESSTEPHHGSPRWRAAPTLLRIGEAATLAGVNPSAIRFWESQGLLNPPRDKESGFRLYDRPQLARLHVVAVLRQASYTFEAIRALLDELAGGRADAALAAVERRRDDLARASKLCARATAALWLYLSKWHGEPPALSGTLPRATVAPLTPLLERRL